RTIECRDWLRRSFTQGEDALSENRMTLIPQAERAGQMKENPRAADGAANAGYDVPPAFARSVGIPAIDVVSQRLEESGIRMERGIGNAMTLFLRQGNEIGKQGEAIPHAAAPARDDEELALPRPRRHRALIVFRRAMVLPGNG